MADQGIESGFKTDNSGDGESVADGNCGATATIAVDEDSSKSRDSDSHSTPTSNKSITNSDSGMFSGKSDEINKNDIEVISASQLNAIDKADSSTDMEHLSPEVPALEMDCEEPKEATDVAVEVDCNNVADACPSEKVPATDDKPTSNAGEIRMPLGRRNRKPGVSAENTINTRTPETMAQSSDEMQINSSSSSSTLAENVVENITQSERTPSERRDLNSPSNALNIQENVSLESSEDEEGNNTVSVNVNDAADANSFRNVEDDANDVDDNDDDIDDDDEEDDDDDDDEDDEDDDNDLLDYNGASNAVVDNASVEEVLNKPKSSYTWNTIRELMHREHGLSGNGRASLHNSLPIGFNTRFYSSRHVVERLKLSHCLRWHNGCVNCLNFDRSGNMLCSGSDDLRIVIGNWAENSVKHCFKSGHKQNIFQTKFINDLTIISASRDGQVRRAPIGQGGIMRTSCLYTHQGAVHKIAICPQNPYEFISVGEDGFIRHCDLRSNSGSNELLYVIGKRNRKVRLFSISHHPFAPEIVVCGCDNLVQVFDTRNVKNVVHQMCPEHLLNTPTHQVTCSVYNSTGTEVLSSYSDNHIYLFNNKEYKSGEYMHCYKGHFNHRTIKGVNFFGPNSEYVISGSDCGNIFFWDKNTEAIVNFLPGDTNGVVNCLEPHPTIPVLATSGLDHNIKMWTPTSEIYPPDLSKLKNCVKLNLKRLVEDRNQFGAGQFHYFIQHFLHHTPGRGNESDSDNMDVYDEPMPSVSSSSTSSSDNEFHQYHGMGIDCRTQ